MEQLVIKLVNNSESLLIGAHLNKTGSLGLTIFMVKEFGSLGIKIVVLEEEHDILFIDLEAQISDVNDGTLAILRLGGLVM